MRSAALAVGDPRPRLTVAKGDPVAKLAASIRGNVGNIYGRAILDRIVANARWINLAGHSLRRSRARPFRSAAHAFAPSSGGDQSVRVEHVHVNDAGRP